MLRRDDAGKQKERREYEESGPIKLHHAMLRRGEVKRQLTGFGVVTDGCFAGRKMLNTEDTEEEAQRTRRDFQGCVRSAWT